MQVTDTNSKTQMTGAWASHASSDPHLCWPHERPSIRHFGKCLRPEEPRTVSSEWDVGLCEPLRQSFLFTPPDADRAPLHDSKTPIITLDGAKWAGTLQVLVLKSAR